MSAFYLVLAFFTDMDIVWERISKHTAGNSASKEKVCNLKSELVKHILEKSGELFFFRICWNTIWILLVPC